MSFKVQCPNEKCATSFERPLSDTGKIVTCPACQTPVVLPLTLAGGHAGRTLGGFRLVRFIARGGMGEIYEATQLNLDRRVALKVLNSDLSIDERFIQRFEREAKSAASINHPNLVQVYDYGQADMHAFLAMEFIEGEDLGRRVTREGPFKPALALRLVEDVASALEAAHAHGIIHRDIKPANILFTNKGVVKVSDLGLARRLDDDLDLTATGAGIGSPHFMSPEQAKDAHSVDHRADIYSLGITLFYLLTATRPFDGQTAYAIILAHANNALPRPADIGVPLPENIETLIRRMTAKLPANRHQTYAELLADIRRVKAGQPIASVTSADAETLVSATTFEPPPGAAAPTPASGPDRTPVPAEAERGRRWLLLPATIVFAAIAIVVALVATKHPSAGKPGDKQAPVSPNEPPSNDGTREPPPFAKGRKGPPSPLAPIEDIVNPLTDGPVAAMWEQAKTFAAANTNDFRGMFARFEQVQQKARGTALERQVAPAIDQWTVRRNAALEQAINQFNARMATAERSLGQHCVSVWRDFPDELRSREVDARIYDIVLKTVERVTGGGGGFGGPPPEEFLKRGPGPDGEPGPKGPKGGPDGDKKGGKGPPEFEPKGKRRPDDPGGRPPPQ